MKNVLFVLALHFTFLSFSQTTAYKIYTSKGKKTSYEKLVKEISQNEFIFFGELHNNPISHWFELEITQDLAKKKDVILSAEMFEADNQAVLNSYLSSEISKEAFETLARFWQNYDTDYAPLVEFAKANQLPFVAANVPRIYASLVYHNGLQTLDSLPQNEKKWIATLPITFDSTINCYANITKMAHGHGGNNLAKAQALKDATMAYFILENHQRGKTTLHFNGAYHSENKEGVIWYLLLNGVSSIGTVTTVSQKDVNKLEKENYGKADFIICVDEDMTKTY